ncbi:hypothetical protein C2845_PM04G19620 [Panicum miliaceum]|uniref:Uncharacterized protein n=1 Tax=Panicum miliaceum TaxID=4540 RepID=A0A3L6QSX6_PANMI|nr:hypothetical protein C2845_PM04G19620 [Panicum miliaceum]
MGCSSAPYGLNFCCGEDDEDEGGREEEHQLLEVDNEEEEDSATTDGRPLWSVLVGCTSADHPSHDLRIHYFRVTASGCIIGRNTDLLELFCVHVQRDGMTYFIRGAKLFAYKNPPNWDKPFAAPIVIGNIWPYDEEGCATRHALITTLSIRGSIDESGCFIPNGVDILHSTCRRIDMLRSNAPGYTCCDTFCFLQKYQVRGAKFHPSDLSEMGRFYCPQGVKFSEMLACYREFLSGKPEPGRGVIPLDFCKIATGSDFYFILCLYPSKQFPVEAPEHGIKRIDLGEFDEDQDREASQQPSSRASPEYVLVSLAVLSLAVHHPL